MGESRKSRKMLYRYRELYNETVEGKLYGLTPHIVKTSPPTSEKSFSTLYGYIFLSNTPSTGSLTKIP